MYKIMYEMIIGYDADMAQIDHFIVSDDKIIPRVHTNEIMYILEFTWDKLYIELLVGFEFINLSDHKDLVFMCMFLLNIIYM